jgi:hypothetical protein
MSYVQVRDRMGLTENDLGTLRVIQRMEQGGAFVVLDAGRSRHAVHPLMAACGTMIQNMRISSSRRACTVFKPAISAAATAKPV